MNIYLAVMFELGGTTYRFSSASIDDTVNGYTYRSGLQTDSISKTIDVTQDINITVRSDDNWPAIAESLHWMCDGGSAEVQVIIKDGDSYTVESWYRGSVQGFQWGERSTPVSFTIASMDSRAYTLPPEQAVISGDTQPPSSVSARSLSIGNAGKPYPLIIGHPGGDTLIGTIAIVPATVANVQNDGVNFYADLIVSDGRIDATEVLLFNKTMGTTTNNPVTLSVGSRLDKLDRRYSYVAMGTGGSFIGAWGSEDDSYCLGFDSDTGGIVFEGQVLRKAGDIIKWILTEHTDYQVDISSIETYRAFFNQYAFDTYINSFTDAASWLRDAVLKFIPGRLACGPQGVFVAPIPTKPDRLSARKTLTHNLNCARESLEVEPQVFNELTVNYCPNSDVNHYHYQTFRSPNDNRLTGVGISILSDARITGSSICQQSNAIYGAKKYQLDLPTVCESNTAERIADDFINMWAFPQIYVTYSCDPEFYDTIVGETVLINDPDAGITNKYAVVNDVIVKTNSVSVKCRVYNNTQQTWE